MNPNYEMYYESNQSNRSPNSYKQASLHRQGSRNQFEAQGYLPSGLYTAEDHAFGGYDANRYAGNMRSATVGGYGGGYDMGGQAWNAGAFNNNNHLNGLGGTGARRQPQPRGGRSNLPSTWLDQPQQVQMNHTTPYLGGTGHMNGHMRHVPTEGELAVDDDLIPTAIVIKNIPFNVKKELIVEIMTEMGLPLPYAFNYHFDNGIFRGLAFANFTNADETAIVIGAMNHYDLNGRKLRVEYKKMLPAAERERIEREKRERRGQLEEQHRPMAPGTLQTQLSASSLAMPNLHSPSPVSGRYLGTQHGTSYGASSPDAPPMGSELNLNDPQTLEVYNKLLLFKHDTTHDRYPFPSALSPQERRIVHTVAHNLGLGHTSRGEANQRAVIVFKETAHRVSPPMPQISNLRAEGGRGLSRAATTDFADVRGNDGSYGGPRHHGSAYLGPYNDASAGLGPGSNLRAAKSFADLRSYTPSPVPSTASFPAALRNNVASLQDFGRDSTQSNTPTLMTPTSGLADRGENNIINGLGNMNLGGGFGGSPHRLRGIASWDRENPGPVGAHRSFSTNFDGRPQVGPERQPRGPLAERGAGFPRNRTNGHMTRNSDELSQQSSSAEITVE